VSTKSLVEAVFEDSDSELSTERYISGDEYVFEKQIPPRKPRFNSPPSISLVQEQTISWSQSGTKRLFDFLCVLLLIRQENSDIVFPPISAKNAEMDGAP